MPPDDQKDVIKAIRLGWSLSEVRGRNQRMVNGPNPPEISDFETRVLPLRAERPPTERRIEAQRVFIQMAKDLNVNNDATGTDIPTQIDADAKSIYVFLFGDTEKQVLPNPTAAAGAWAALAKKIYFYDAWVEDKLASTSESLSSGYQLGRGLADAYWFDAHRFTSPPPDNAEAMWTELLGKSRCDELGRLMGRLSSYFNQFTPPAVAGSVKTWEAVAADGSWRNAAGAENKLILQLRRWYELLVIGQDPTTLVPPFSIFRSFKASRKVFRAFIQEIGLLLLSLIAVGFLAYLSTTHKTSAFENSLITIASGVGITIAGLQARIKNATQSLLSRIKDDAQTELIAASIVEIPPTPDLSEAKRRAKTIELMGQRRLTTAAG